MQSSISNCRLRQSQAAYPRVWGGQSTRFLTLLLTRFTMRLPLLPDRWALTPPFHPYPFRGGILSVALSVALRLPGVTRRHVLWSSDFPLRRIARPSDCLKNLRFYNQTLSRLSKPDEPMKSLASALSASSSSLSSDAVYLAFSFSRSSYSSLSS